MKKFLTMLSVFGICTAASANETVQLRTGIILDQSSQSVVVMLPEGGVAALDVNSGEAYMNALTNSS